MSVSREKRYKSCLHCSRAGYTYSRGLCRSCHSILAIRCQYPCQSREKGDFVESVYLADNRRKRYRGVATAAMPGTEAKLQVLEDRVRRGEELFHPGDAVDGD